MVCRLWILALRYSKYYRSVGFVLVERGFPAHRLLGSIKVRLDSKIGNLLHIKLTANISPPKAYKSLIFVGCEASRSSSFA